MSSFLIDSLTPVEPIRAWSAEQRNWFDWCRDGKDNAILRSRAGTGKTTTTLEGSRYMPESSILYGAFNKDIAESTSARIKRMWPDPKNPAPIVAKTIHAVGMRLVMDRWTQLRKVKNAIDNRGRKIYLTEKACRMLHTEDTPIPIKKCITDLHCKGRELAPYATQWEDLVSLAEQYDCLPDEEEWGDSGFDVTYVARHALTAMEIAATFPVPDEELKYEGAIDFADMIYLPLRNRWLRKLYGAGLLDEAQDINKPQIDLFMGVIKGRIGVIGDDRQAIYGWRGADSESLDRLKAVLKARELKLTVTYRCGKAITALAARLVPDFSAHESNHEGVIRTVAGQAQMMTEAGPGDFILSRKNAPLADIAMGLIRLNKRVVIRGRDFGADLQDLAEKIAKGHGSRSMPMFLSKLETWVEKQCARAVKSLKDPELAQAKTEQIRDRAETLKILAEGCVSVTELRARIDGLFSDLKDMSTLTMLSSIHKAKGLEAERVYVLVDTLYPKLPPHLLTPARKKEEQNLEYVAQTRAIRELVLVSTEAK